MEVWRDGLGGLVGDPYGRLGLLGGDGLEESENCSEFVTQVILPRA